MPLLSQGSTLLKRVRTSRAAWSMLTSYFAFFSATLWSLVSIPIAVRYLDRDAMGLWTLVNAFLSYLVWMDMGISHATSRLMAPAVAKNDQTEINRWWTATSAALWAQALLVLICGLALTPLAVSLLRIDPHLREDALWLLGAGAVVTAFSLPLRCVPGFLTAQERFHWVPLVQGMGPWSNLLVFYFLLRAGWGVKSYVVAVAATQVVNWIAYSLLVRMGPQRPRFDRRGLQRARFKQLFRFSGSLMVIGTVDSFISTLPSLLLGRLGGLGLVPNYNFSTKGAILGSSLVARTYQAFQPAWQRSFVAGHLELFRSKYEAAGYITLGIATCGAVVVLTVNPLLVGWLAGANYFAGSSVNLWIAIGVITLPLGSYFQSLLTLSGNLERSSLFFLLKLALAIGLGFAGWHMAKMVGIAAVFSLLPLFNGAYGFWAGSRKCGFSWDSTPSKGVAFGTLLAIATIVLTGLLLQFASNQNPSGFWLDWMKLLETLPATILGLGLIAWGGRLNFRKKQLSAETSQTDAPCPPP